LIPLVGSLVTCASSAPETPLVAPTPVRNIAGSIVAPPSERVAPASIDVVDSLIDNLTVRQKVAQLIMPWLLGNYTALDSREFDRISSWVDELELGGIIISIGSPLDASAKLNALQKRSPVPLLIAADLEWGSGMRLVGGTLFPMAMAFGATGNVNEAYALGRAAALAGRAAGIHMTFSPVADVNSNPDNPIINTRSFGEDPDAVAALVEAYIHGANEHGLFTTAKPPVTATPSLTRTSIYLSSPRVGINSTQSSSFRSELRSMQE
jgi:beta-N-acetylhexosaminidase